MKSSNKITCVTGASGTIGGRIVQLLIDSGYTIRVLSRKREYYVSGVEHYVGDINDEALVKTFVSGASIMFHCAAEIRDTSKMWDVNVNAMERLFHLLQWSEIKYFCYISSAGVVGKTSEKWVQEHSICKPQNIYEHSKYAAENIVRQGLQGRRVVILRPTNVVDDRDPGALRLPMRASWSDWLKVFLKGGECAHIIHAEDVARAAVYLVSHSEDSISCYFVSCDNEPLNTYAGLWALYRAIERDEPVEGIRPVCHLPVPISHVLRKLWKGVGNRGDVRYSSDKLLSTGFQFHLGVNGVVRRIASIKNAINS